MHFNASRETGSEHPQETSTSSPENLKATKFSDTLI